MKPDQVKHQDPCSVYPVIGIGITPRTDPYVWNYPCFEGTVAHAQSLQPRRACLGLAGSTISGTCSLSQFADECATPVTKQGLCMLRPRPDHERRRDVSSICSTRKTRNSSFNASTKDWSYPTLWIFQQRPDWNQSLPEKTCLNSVISHRLTEKFTKPQL